MTTVGPRLLELDKKERDNFFTAYKLAEEMIKEENESEEDEGTF
jgi:hypothetical protein